MAIGEGPTSDRVGTAILADRTPAEWWRDADLHLPGWARRPRLNRNSVNAPAGALDHIEGWVLVQWPLRHLAVGGPPRQWETKESPTRITRHERSAEGRETAEG